MPADFSILDEPMSLLDLARRWGTTKKRLVYLCDTRDIGPSGVISNVGVYGAVEQEQIARALETKRRQRSPRRSVAPVTPSAR